MSDEILKFLCKKRSIKWVGKFLCKIGLHDFWQEYKPVPNTPTAKLILKCRRCGFELEDRK